MLSAVVMAHIMSRSLLEGAGGRVVWERLVWAISETRVRLAKSR
jgi:hypothetical protein